MPKFTWNIDPVFFEIPINVVIIGLVVAALLSFLGAWRKRASDLGLFGVALLVIAFLISKFAQGPLEIRYYSLIFVGVFLGGYSLLNWQIKRGGGDEEEAGDFIVYGVIAVLLGARLGHVIFYDREKAMEDPMWIFQIWTGGLASHGAVIGLIIAMWLFTRKRGVPFLEGADRFSFSAALGATLVRLGNFFNSEIVGRQTDGSWGVQFPRFDRNLPTVPYRHPSQLYEVALGLAVIGLLLLVDKWAGKEKRPRGLLISTFFVAYFTGRFGIEFFKEYEAISPDSPLTMGQYLSIPGILLGVFGVWWSMKRKLPAGWHSNRELPDEDSDEDLEGDEQRSEHYDEDVDEEFGGRRARLAAEARRRRYSGIETRGGGAESGPGKKKKKKKKKRRAAPVDDSAGTEPSTEPEGTPSTGAPASGDAKVEDEEPIPETRKSPTPDSPDEERSG